MPFQKLNKLHIRESFNDAAESYDKSAVVQRESGKRLLELTAAREGAPCVIVDIGCGTGHDSMALRVQFPNSMVVSMDIALAMLKKARELGESIPDASTLLCADAESLPLRDDSVDLIFSNAAFNWFNDLESTLQNFHIALKDRGTLLFSLFGPNTLIEIRDAWKQAGSKGAHVNTFLSSKTLQDMLMEAGFKICHKETFAHHLYFENPRAAINSIRNVGGKNALSERQKGMTGKNLFNQFINNLAKTRTEKGIPITYEVLYFSAAK